MEPNKNNGPGKNGPENNKPKWNIWVALVVTVAIILLINLAFYAIGDYLQYTTDGYSFGFPYVPMLSDISRTVVFLTYNHPILYAIFGILFRMFGLPKRKKT